MRGGETLMANPNSDEALLQQHYGDESAMVAHVEAWHLHNSMEAARYCDYYNRERKGLDFNAERRYLETTYGVGKEYFGEKK